jgi:ribosomal protein L40E
VRKKPLPQADRRQKEMFCSKCGAPLSEDAAFCSKCGNKVADTETAVASGRTDSAETAVKETPHLSAETDAALKHKSKLCFFLAFFPLILTVPIGVMSGVMAIPWANSAVAVPLYVAGWFFFVKRHGFGRGAAAGVTALFSLLGASLVPIIPICAWHVWHLRMIYPEKRPTVNDHLVLAILSQLAVVPCIVIGTKLCMIGSDYLSVRAEVLGVLCFACALPASWALKNSKKVASFNLELKSGKDEAESTARKAKWLAIAGFVLPIAFFAVFCFVFGPQSFSAIYGLCR